MQRSRDCGSRMALSTASVSFSGSPGKNICVTRRDSQTLPHTEKCTCGGRHQPPESGTGYAPGFVLAGAVVVELALIAAFAFLFFRIGRLAHRGVDNTRKSAGTQPAPAFRTALKPLQLTASVLLVVGMVWFFLRLKG